MDYQKEWFFFHTNLKGFTLYENFEPIEKYIVFWRGVSSKSILSGNSSVKAIENKKRKP